MDIRKFLLTGIILASVTTAETTFASVSSQMEKSASTNSAVQSSENLESSARDYITKFYTEIIPLVNDLEPYDKVIKRYFSPEFVKVYTTVDEDVPEGEMGFFDSDFISDSQDPDIAKAVVKSVVISKDSNGKIVANVKVSLMSKVYAPAPIELKLVKTDDGWKISDYNNILEPMIEFKKEMKALK